MPVAAYSVFTGCASVGHALQRVRPTSSPRQAWCAAVRVYFAALIAFVYFVAANAVDYSVTLIALRAPLGFRDSLVPSSSLPADRGADGWYPDNRARRLARYCDPLDGWQPTAARVKGYPCGLSAAACTTGYSSATPT